MSVASPPPRPEAAGGSVTLRVCALYPDLMSIYADRGNLLMLQRRCVWRGIGFDLTRCGIGEALSPAAHDLIYLGGGQDRDQLICARDLLEVKGDALREAARAGTVVLAVCGGYQLLGRSYELGPGERIEGVGLLDVATVRRQGERLIGNVAIEVDLEGQSRRGSAAGADPAPGPPRVLAGFENHGGRTRLAAGQQPLGRVIKGFGNDGASGWEGARTGNVIGTYLHGPLLPKNAWLADWLIATALRISPDALAPLDDALEDEAHRCARRAAGV